ncbi:DUF397 domain-containing protein [Streptomyces sp. NL15-2K]|uniref:DUF397 domain-containing protein n=1 Tax=Streptomyces sp. NL15-2K TaxID=376149 RepID=UPI000F58210A|nr:MULTISPECIES: DUF397 domain-containing protein [Actinomycetes]WKX12301.1 DUF397 domain-containing protein [Kutzneria buriramensis]GCB46198.1 hypothetical protein SNL152K_3496 [Streptomyces sp. NL15-2K]
MITADTWQKSSYSGGGEGNACVEVALRRTCISIRDSKAPTRAIVTIPTEVFAPFIEALKTAPLKQ